MLNFRMKTKIVNVEAWIYSPPCHDIAANEQRVKNKNSGRKNGAVSFKRKVSSERVFPTKTGLYVLVIKR